MDMVKLDAQAYGGGDCDRAAVGGTGVADCGWAHTLGVQVVAQGIETPEQLEALSRMGCGLGQGPLLSLRAGAGVGAEAGGAGSLGDCAQG